MDNLYPVKIRIYMAVLAMLLFSGCGRFNLTPEVTVIFQDPTQVTESGFSVSWSVNPSDYSSLTLSLASDPSFDNIILTRTFSTNQITSTRLDSLYGYSTYYYRISIVRQPGSIFISSTQSIDLLFSHEQVSFHAPDSALLEGSLTYLKSLEGQRPPVILMHEKGIFTNAWINSKIVRALVAKGYICLIYYNRGHGASAGMDNTSLLETDPAYLARDLQGAMTYLSALPFADPSSVILAGASMGATMALRAGGNDSVRTVVALSPADREIGYLYPDLPLRSVLYIAGEGDRGSVGGVPVDFAEHARTLYERTQQPKELVIVAGSEAHGTELLEQPGVNDEILEWIRLQAPYALPFR